MEINEFISNFRLQFDEPEAINLTSETKFHDLDDWNSLTGLSTIAMADMDYGVVIKPEELKSMITVSDLFNLIKSKL